MRTVRCARRSRPRTSPAYSDDAGFGGGLANHGSATIRGSTLLDNRALLGSGIVNLSGGDLTLVNSTSSWNDMQNGLPDRFAAGTVQLFQVTLTGPGAARRATAAPTPAPAQTPSR
jgi:hypothetical protein